MTTMRRWWVISPVWGEVQPLLDDGSGPIEWGAEVVEVEAPTRRKAIIIGVKKMKFWPPYARYDLETSPFAGVKAEPWESDDES